jgi:Ca2+-binding RTX toxin-like protein
MINFETLETRQFLAASAAAGGPIQTIYGNITGKTGAPILVATSAQAHVSKTGTLVIQGTSAADTITVTHTRPSTGNLIIVPGPLDTAFVTAGDDLHGISEANALYVTLKTDGVTTTYLFDRSTIKRIAIDGGAGNDNITISPNVSLRATILGGKGNDHLAGGILGDTISGGDGNDVIQAGPQDFSVKVGKVFKPVAQQPIGGKLFIPGMHNTLAGTAVFNLVATNERADSADLLEGGKGNDTITAGQGPDTVAGGAGHDVISYAGRHGAAPDFSSDTPVTFDGLTVSSVEDVMVRADVVKVANGIVQFSAGSTISNTIILQ